MSDIVLGTAGHVDHGKTTLIKALTGIDTDRLKDEKLRGITIELGYAYIKTPENHIIGIVDVPGHEKFIKNMVAGVTGIDVVMLIVAADEGVMPQTIEHIEICNLLGVKNGLIVITKIDIVEKDLLELIKEDIDEFKKDTFLKDSPIFFVSSKTGEGIGELKEYLFSLPNLIKKEKEHGLFILPIDRVFTKKGFGTVVTGTTISGKISVGDDILALPENLNGKIRNIQIHGEQVNTVSAGHRTAINIQNIYKDDIKRGSVLTVPDTFETSDICDGHLIYLSSNKKPLKNRLHVKFYSGTSSVPAKIIILDKNEIQPGDNAFVQFFFDRNVFTVHGNRFIIRSFDDKRTLGGGIVLDGTPLKKKRFKKEEIQYLSILLNNSIEDKIIAFANKYGEVGITIDVLISKLNIEREILIDIINKLDLTIFDKRNYALIDKENFSKLAEKLISIIKDFHNQNPKIEGISLEELRIKIHKDLDFNLFEALLNFLKKQGKVKISNGIVSLPDFYIVLNDKDEKNKNLIYSLIKNNGSTPPFLPQIQKEANIDEKEILNLLNILINENKIVKIKPDFYMEIQAYNKIKNSLTKFLKEKGEISIQDFKKIVNASRKFLIPLLEHFDSIKLTIRKGDKRILRS